ncbi:MAG: histidinol-phosphate transaminase [Candidatus Marinimicrobia bacterium]|nr:histidinol-phosphate transaminase [Candidatus Neomarinimicrobiota bacterium]
MDIDKLARRNVRELEPYSCARDEYQGDTGIFLDANENSLGSVLTPGLNRYPDPLQKKLKAKISDVKNIAPENIFLGNGSDEVIDLLIRAFCEPREDRILIMPPTYGMYAVTAGVNAVPVVRAPLTFNYQIDTDAVLKKSAGVKLIFICSPNNPTGNCLNDTDIERILINFDGLVVLDEAYIDFAPERSWAKRLARYPNLVIMQTFSKAWGLANIRLGMGFADRRIIELLNRIKYPYNVNGVTQQLALKGLSRESLKDKMVAQILAERRKLAARLEQLSIVEKVYPSEANFLLVKFENARTIFNYLIDKQIIVRDRSRVVLCDNCLRITVGASNENDELLQQLMTYQGAQ